MSRIRRAAAATAVTVAVTGCGGESHPRSTTTRSFRNSIATTAATAGRRRVNVYRAGAAGRFSPQVRGDRALVYVPNSMSNTVSVISSTR